MDFIDRIRGGGPRLSQGTFKFGELSAPVQKHLEKVGRTSPRCTAPRDLLQQLLLLSRFDAGVASTYMHLFIKAYWSLRTLHSRPHCRLHYVL